MGSAGTRKVKYDQDMGVARKPLASGNPAAWEKVSQKGKNSESRQMHLGDL